jgi:hypothetical protein
MRARIALGELEQDPGDRIEVIAIENAGHALLPKQPYQIAHAVVSDLSSLE